MGQKVYLPTWMIEFPWILKWFYRKLDVSKFLSSIPIVSNFWESFLPQFRPFLSWRWPFSVTTSYPATNQILTFQSLHVVRVQWRELLDDSFPQSRMTSPLWKEKQHSRIVDTVFMSTSGPRTTSEMYASFMTVFQYLNPYPPANDQKHIPVWIGKL